MLFSSGLYPNDSELLSLNQEKKPFAQFYKYLALLAPCPSTSHYTSSRTDEGATEGKLKTATEELCQSKN